MNKLSSQKKKPLQKSKFPIILSSSHLEWKIREKLIVSSNLHTLLLKKSDYKRLANFPSSSFRENFYSFWNRDFVQGSLLVIGCNNIWKPIRQNNRFAQIIIKKQRDWIKQKFHLFVFSVLPILTLNDFKAFEPEVEIWIPVAKSNKKHVFKIVQLILY